jgi:hypothetical protein
VCTFIIIAGSWVLVSINSDLYCCLVRDVSAHLLVMLLLVVGT